MKNFQFEEVIKCGKKITSLDPNDALGWTILGRGYAGMEKYEKSISCYERSLEIKPDNFLTWSQLAMTLEQAGNIDQAINAYQKSIETNPENEFNDNDVALESISNLKGLEKESESTEHEDELLQQIMEMGDLGVECAFHNKPVPVERALDRLDLIRIKVEKYDMLSATEMVIRQIERINRARVN